MTEHYTHNTVSVSAYCKKCGRQTMHRVDAGQRGPCLRCIEAHTHANSPPTGCFFCPDCGKETLHEMTNEGWTKGPCLECKARAGQGSLFGEA